MRLEVRTAPLDGYTILDAKSLPFLVGNSPEQVEWDCACGSRLATGLYARQVLNLVIRCGACSTLLESPSRSPGEPIAGRPVYFPPGGTYLLEGALDVVDKPVMMVGHSALLEYARETGRVIPGIYDPGLSPILEDLSSESLFKMAEKLRSLLGADFERLNEADTRGKHSPTPPRVRHRIIELINFAKDTARKFEVRDGTKSIGVDGNLLAESITVLATTSRWVNHPAWPGLQSTLGSDESVRVIHNVIL